MSEQTYKIAVPHRAVEVFTIKADTWQEAVEVASNSADELGLESIGGFGVYNADDRPIDTFAGDQND